MSEKHARKKNLYEPGAANHFKFSRTKLDNFLKCPRCFYLNLRRGIKQPEGLPFTLNSAVDHLLKKEFDIYRSKKEIHPLMERHGIKAIPFAHEKLKDWRNNFSGIQHIHAETNFLVFGAIDDVWVNDEGKLYIVDYKATSKESGLSLDNEWQKGWKRQMEIYQWLFRKNGFDVSDTGYFVYCNGKKDREGLNGKLEFDIEIHPYQGDDKWIEAELKKAKECLESDEIPDYTEECDFCNYQQLLKPILE
ncbi:MAG: PD-(D/E)XK nuclease family protein [Planctomycetota bacterium]